MFSCRGQVGTCGPSLKPAHPLVGRLAVFILETHWGAWVLCRWPSLDKGQAQELPVFLSSAGDKSQCLQRYRGWGSLSLTASLAARGVWCPAQAASFACRVLKTSSSEL